MANQIKITFLGTAANGGLPQADCRCKNCMSNQTRLRSSFLLELNNQRWILDAGPDFKNQLEQHQLKTTDLTGIIISHLHADHCIGLSELGFGKPNHVPIVSHPRIITDLLTHQSFGFLFKGGFAELIDKPKWLNFNLIPHDPLFPTAAILIKNGSNQIFIASDIAWISPGIQKAIFQSQLVIIDGTFLEQSAHWHQAIRTTCHQLKEHPGQIVFTHINHSEDPQEITTLTSQFNFQLAHDNLTIEL